MICELLTIFGLGGWCYDSSTYRAGPITDYDEAKFLAQVTRCALLPNVYGAASPDDVAKRGVLIEPCTARTFNTSVQLWCIAAPTRHEHEVCVDGHDGPTAQIRILEADGDTVTVSRQLADGSVVGTSANRRRITISNDGLP